MRTSTASPGLPGRCTRCTPRWSRATPGGRCWLWTAPSSGIVFAKSLDDPQTGYALTLGESRRDLITGASANDQVSTGGCAVG